MPISRLLIANRGEVAIRIARAAADIGVETVAVYSDDDRQSLHVRAADETRALEGRGVSPYLDSAALVAIATECGCDAVHPGYGFLAENAEFAAAAAAGGVVFVGPSAPVVELLGDKARARAEAQAAGVPILRGTDGASTREQAAAFLSGLGEGGAIMIKAVAGGGGRGMRVVDDPATLDESWDRCGSEAQAAFGCGELYVEELIACARHIEVQIVGDATGAVVHLGERECSLQRRHQKIVEIAPAPNLAAELRARICAAAVELASRVGYESLGTFEFLVDAAHLETFAFIEANARLQVEHTVTEEITGVDLVQAQLAIAGGATLADLGLADGAAGRGCAIQARVNMETMNAEGQVLPAGGTLTAYDAPSGPGVRTDGFGYAGYTTSPSFDSLLAKVIGHVRTPDLAAAAKRTRRALAEFRIEGVETNIQFLEAVLSHPDVLAGEVTTRWIDDHVGELVARSTELGPRRFAPVDAGAQVESVRASGFAGAQIGSSDPLALFEHDRSVKASVAGDEDERLAGLTAPDGSVGVPAPIQGTIVEVFVSEGDKVHQGQLLVVVEAMKMEHEIVADRSGFVRRVAVVAGDVMASGHPVVFIEEADVGEADLGGAEELDPDFIRPDLDESFSRHAYTLDENRAYAVERRRKTGQRTARENIEDVVDDGSFVEYGPLVLAAQRRRRTMEWLRTHAAADGLIMGVGTVNADKFPDQDARCVAISYDYTVLAGTQGHKNHYKQDRIFELASRFRLPIIFFTEGGGGRPGDTDSAGGIGMDVYTFTQWSKLSGKVPLVGVNSGRCFAGNTALLGCCDVIIAAKDSTIAMGGPAMIEGGGLGVFTPEEVGPMAFQVPNGVVDILVEDEAEATRVARQYLSYFQGPTGDWEAHDQRPMRHIVPEDRKRMYDVRDVIHRLADVDS
ncbi:MAG: biotin carboxylase N-terminal domain-containing protein, partial [Acidobacteriota bacterium]|nr:biotin carboxylase N-terminal domain-containing protein [Acidobacteriota bacterium]